VKRLLELEGLLRRKCDAEAEIYTLLKAWLELAPPLHLRHELKEWEKLYMNQSGLMLLGRAISDGLDHPDGQRESDSYPLAVRSHGHPGPPPVVANSEVHKFLIQHLGESVVTEWDATNNLLNQFVMRTQLLVRLLVPFIAGHVNRFSGSQTEPEDGETLMRETAESMRSNPEARDMLIEPIRLFTWRVGGSLVEHSIATNEADDLTVTRVINEMDEKLQRVDWPKDAGRPDELAQELSVELLQPANIQRLFEMSSADLGKDIRSLHVMWQAAVTAREGFRLRLSDAIESLPGRCQKCELATV